MKNILVIAGIVTICIGTFSSCKKSSSSPLCSMKATVGATTISTSNCFFTHDSSTLTISGNYTGPVGNPFDIPSIYISIRNWNGAAGAFTLRGGTNAVANLTTIPYQTDTAQSGIITLTSVSMTRISGEFSYICSDGTKVTNGSFTASGN